MGDQELDELARRYLDLWQDQASALAADPAFGEALGRFVEAGLACAGGLMSAWTAWQGAFAEQAVRSAAEASAASGANQEDARHAGGGSRHEGRRNGGRQDDGAGGTAAGAAPTAAAPLGGGGDLGELTRRLATLERRLEQLERQLERSRDTPRGARRSASSSAPRRRS